MQNMSPTGPLAEGSTLRDGKYVISHLLGKGGTGWVYVAAEPILERDVVIKIIDPDLIDDEVTKSALVYEARAAVKLDHPNVIKVYTYEQEDIGGQEFIFLAIEYAKEGDLREAFGDLVNTDLDRYRIMIDVLKGLQYIHKQGIIHRDLKPDNLFVSGKVVKLGDLGTAKAIGEKTRQLSTQGIMTPVYSSPEQLNFEPLDQRSDIYTCGIIFFEIMTGKRPYKHYDEHLNKSPVPLITDLVDDLNEDVSEIIGRMMAKSIDHRYQNVDEILMDLRQVDELVDGGLFDDEKQKKKQSDDKDDQIDVATSIIDLENLKDVLPEEKAAEPEPAPAAPEPETPPAPQANPQMTLLIRLVIVLILAVGILIALLLARVI